MTYLLQNTFLKPLATYFGLPLDARPTWWTVLAAVVSASVVWLVVGVLRKQGAPRSVWWGSVIFVALSQVAWLALTVAVQPLIEAAKEDVFAASRLPWPLWLFSNVLFIGAAYAAARFARAGEPAWPERGWLVGSWVWVALMVVTSALAAWSVVQIRAIMADLPL